MPRRKQPPREVSRTGNPGQESFVSDELLEHEPRPAPATSSSDRVLMCRCNRGPRAPGKLFCDPCFTEYSKLWTEPASTEFGICAGAGGA